MSDERQPRQPSFLDAIAPVVVLIALIALTIATFGVAATDGPLQVALVLSAGFASLVALKNGFKSAALADAAVGGVSTAVSAIFILLAVPGHGQLVDDGRDARRRLRRDGRR